ncbi:MAG: SpoVR family protein [Deltaproteobacteria bacterium]|nr:SpoVR family protein [Deltaproteobacteria bacterium]
MKHSFSRLPRHLREIQAKLTEYARGFGLDFYTIMFEVLSYEEMNEVASYGGFPKRYPHWRFGMEYERMSKSYSYGLHKIYEMVINNDPCYAYLLEGNSLVDQRMVMAHVMAHCDFFKNNMFFAHTNRKMMNAMANHGARIAGYMNRFGRDEVERLLDSCLSLDNLIDPIRAPGMVRGETPERESDAAAEPSGADVDERSYMFRFMEPGEPDDGVAEDMEPEPRPLSIQADAYGQDVMGFLLHHAPLKGWEQTVLDIVRREAYYFVPQAQTKIMNEGWATYWHSRIMTEKVLTAADVVDYADHASSVLATTGNQINPYKLGVELFRHIQSRWDSGRFGKEYEECTDAAARASWDMETGQGLRKIFEGRRCYNDITFIDEFFTDEFCEEQNLFTMRYVDHRERWEVISRSARKVKMALLGQLTNLGNPIISVLDANHANRGELLLAHQHEGADLRIDWARDVLENLCRLWKRPVHIATVLKDKEVHLRYDGQDHSILEQDEAPPPESEDEG